VVQKICHKFFLKIKNKKNKKSTGAKLVNLFCWPCLGGQGNIVF
jgi:hypothetical protein